MNDPVWFNIYVRDGKALRAGPHTTRNMAVKIACVACQNPNYRIKVTYKGKRK